MKKSTKLLTAGIIGAIVIGTSLTAIAQKASDMNQQRANSSELISQAKLDLDEAMTIALADVPGRVIEAELEKENDDLVWEIEIVDNQNQVFELEIDAMDGEILDKESDND